MNFAVLSVLLSCAWGAPARPIDQEIAGIVDFFYDLQLDRALEASDNLKARHPGHPAGDFYRSVVFFERYLLENPRSADTFKAYENANAVCLDAARAYRAKDPATSELYLAAGYGFFSRALAMQRRYREAISNAKRSLAHVKVAIELEPERDDAYLGLGMFNYFMSRVPSAVKPLVYMMVGGWGNRDLGLSQLHRVADKGTAARMEARRVLSAIYASPKEKQWDKSEVFLAELVQRYPHNPLYRLRRAFVAQARGRFDLALELSDPDGAWIDHLAPELRKKTRAYARYRAAESLLILGKPKEAQAHLDALDPNLVPDSMREWVYLRKAQCLKAPGAAAPRIIMGFSDRSGLTD